MLGLIRHILKMSPATVSVPPVIVAVVFAESVSAVAEVILATVVLAAMPVPVTASPGTMFAIDDTLVTEALLDAAVAVGVTVACIECPAFNNSALNEVHIAEVMPAISNIPLSVLP